MNKHKFVLRGLVAVLALCLIVSTRAQDAPPKKASRHCLWEVKGASNVVYLLGSFHLLKRSDYPLAAPIRSAFSNSPIAVFETKIDKLESPEVVQKLMTNAMLPADRTLAQELSPRVYASFSNHVVAAGLSLFMFDHMKPSLAATTLEIVEIQRLGFNPKYGVDWHFFRLARSSGKQIVPLESVDFQLSLLAGFSKAEEDGLMASTLEDIDKTKRLIGEMVAAWKAGDTAKLENLLNTARHEAPGSFKRLITDRNRSWIPKIERLLRGQTNAIVIVGAGHLVGNDGVVELLRKDGHKVLQR